MKTKKNKRSNNRTYKKLSCATKKEGSIKDTCYTSDALNTLKKHWNARHPDAKIKSKDSNVIWKTLKKNMEHTCKNEKCWLKQNFIKNNVSKEMLNYTFTPTSPQSWNKNPNEWLTSTDIENVMAQYENAYPQFNFIGPSPIDFDKRKLGNMCVWNELCKFDIKNCLKRNCNKVGIIFNTDPHYLDGSHWIALFVNIGKREIIYFDSVADPCPKEVEKLIDRIMKQGENMDIQFNKKYNKIKHQNLNTECGMYCLYFIIENLKNSTESLNKRIPDEKIERFRKIYFNPNESNL